MCAQDAHSLKYEALLET